MRGKNGRELGGLCARVLVAAVSVPDSMASWGAGMFVSCHLCPFILVAERGRQVARLRGSPGFLCPPAQEGEWGLRPGRGQQGGYGPVSMCGVGKTPGWPEGAASCPSGADVAASHSCVGGPTP